MSARSIARVKLLTESQIFEVCFCWNQVNVFVLKFIWKSAVLKIHLQENPSIDVKTTAHHVVRFYSTKVPVVLIDRGLPSKGLKPLNRHRAGRRRPSMLSNFVWIRTPWSKLRLRRAPRGPNRQTGSNLFAIERTSRRRPIAGKNLNCSIS